MSFYSKCTLRLIVCFTCILAYAHAQKKHEDIRKHLPTENVDINAKKDANRPRYRSNKSKYAIIYRPHAKNIMYGNPCAIEATHNMGFEYLIEPRGIKGSRQQIEKFFNNLWVKIKLVTTRSPFWKLILKKQLKKCRRLAGMD